MVLVLVGVVLLLVLVGVGVGVGWYWCLCWLVLVLVGVGVGVGWCWCWLVWCWCWCIPHGRGCVTQNSTNPEKPSQHPSPPDITDLPDIPEHQLPSQLQKASPVRRHLATGIFQVIPSRPHAFVQTTNRNRNLKAKRAPFHGGDSGSSWQNGFVL